MAGSDLCLMHLKFPPGQRIPKSQCRCGAYDFPHAHGTGKCSVDKWEVRAPVTAGELRQLQPRRKKAATPFDEVNRRHFMTLVAAGHGRYQSCKILGVSYDAMRRLIKSDPGFADRVTEVEEQATEPVELCVRELALGKYTGGIPHFEACRWLLANRNPDRWKRDPDKLEVRLSGQVDHQLEVGPVLERIELLRARLSERQALAAGVIVEAETVDGEDQA